MKDFLQEYGRTAAIFAAAAFVLSFLVGLFAGNPFLTVFFRAFLLAVAFTAVGVGLVFVVKKYLPELLGAPPQGVAEVAERHSVDITLPEEIPGGTPGSREDIEPEELEAADAVEPGEGGAAEVMEELGPSSGSGNADVAVLEGEIEDSAEPAVSVEPVAGAVGISGEESHPALKKSSQGGIDSLESLPDFGNLGNFTSPGKSAGAPSAPPLEAIKPRRPSSAAQAIGDESPETLAKAIRTVIKRDERG